jgi:hypothetical protein
MLHRHVNGWTSYLQVSCHNICLDYSQHELRQENIGIGKAKGDSKTMKVGAIEVRKK